ncbi:PREDICTED: type I inositol polyphosphate 5-phosphatase 10 [Tarenaya hassleriana]|uniref:type I inositol polyphosphate 5-phosphatase 10 n=1 Tax=Tarenaya hassleriana TaxID=28532 RepID=UPI00053C0E75|nr:PREDICTED: type I inositol polyphosphate 5-phosphatase 10 [Tarenaya hassleriana]
MPTQQVQSLRVFVATWNVGGKSPHAGIALDGLLHARDEFDVYVLGFQEIVPLNAGNVLVIEDNEPAAKWLALINQALNNPSNGTGSKILKLNPSFGAGSMFFAKPSLKRISESFRTECRRKLKMCNCSVAELERKYGRESCFRCPESMVNLSGFPSDEEEGEEDDDERGVASLARNQTMKYSLVASKRMVGIFLTVWMRKELVPHVSHLRISSVTRGIMGCLGNKGCIAVSMLMYKTSFCFICTHLASGEREGDERRRNSDVIEILRNTAFPRICRTPFTRVPDRITKHDRIIWLGDLNYRIALSYYETRNLLEKNAWDALLDKDQLKIEREAGRVFKGWQEGKIYFAPTYKYSYNSDSYAGETNKEKNKRRTPAWCDRILWRGNGIQQLSYSRGESRFSDHRPVTASFLVDVKICCEG